MKIKVSKVWDINVEPLLRILKYFSFVTFLQKLNKCTSVN